MNLNDNTIEKLNNMYGVDLNVLNRYIDNIETNISVNGRGEDILTVYIPTGVELSEDTKGVPTPSITNGTRFVYFNLDRIDTFNSKEKQIGGGLTNFYNINPKDKRIFFTENTKEALSLVSCGLNCVSLNESFNQLYEIEEHKRTIQNFPQLKDFLIGNFSYLIREYISCYFICEKDHFGESQVYKLLKPVLDKSFENCNSYDYKMYDFIRFDCEIEKLITEDKDKFLSELNEKTLEQNNICDYEYYVKYEREKEKENLKKTFSTGLSELDDALGGGLHFGVYSIGATSGLGKTTFVSQIGENLANKDILVLNYSLEMNNSEIFEKGEKRQFYYNCLGGTSIRYTGLDKDNKEELRKIYQAFDLYDGEMVKAFSDYIKGNYKVIPTTFDYTVTDLEENLKYWISKFPEKDICVIVDYCQLLNTDNEKVNLNDKLRVDKVLYALKKISDNYKNVIVLNVSSLNRQSYYSPIDLSSFKESGGIEYTSNCVIGLDYQIIYDKEFQALGDSKTAKATRKEMYFEHTSQLIKQIKVSILKNRRGKRTFCDLKFNPIYNVFENS